MSSIDNLTEYFSKFPGIGARQARRFVYFLLQSNHQFTDNLSKEITQLKKNIRQCSHCYRYFEGSSPACSLCDTLPQKTKILVVVEKDPDLDAIQKTNTHYGHYFVLGGLLPLSDKKNVSLRINEFLKKIEHEALNGELEEIVFALSANPEGDLTVHHLKGLLQPLTKKYSLKMTTLGRGLSTGTELEYSDEETIKNALENRK